MDPLRRWTGEVLDPWDVGEAIVALADVWGIDTDHVEGRLLDNLRRLSSLMQPK